VSKLKQRDLVILGLLIEEPRYGYDIKNTVDAVMSHIIDMSSGSLYYGLRRLLEAGYVEEAAVEKVGRRPERSIYRATEEGREAFNKQLPEAIFPQDQQHFAIDLALYFIDILVADEVEKRLKMRLESLRQAREYLSELLSIEHERKFQRRQKYILQHRLMFTNMETEFIQMLRSELSKPAGHTYTPHTASTDGYMEDELDGFTTPHLRQN
jgi:DNA-binding PadR family transcriptional regulator